ncbi:MAG TPA: hypothetical protein VGH53_30460 [Streptosporangiaceae bacterium]|jgi:S-(hydroxymethyl)glutathione dehydrogenase/alcohol dehydrogenase
MLQPEMVQEALDLTSKGGRMFLTGRGEAGMAQVSLAQLWLPMMQKEICGAVFGGCDVRRDIPGSPTYTRRARTTWSSW